ncbi:MAG: hypothetical protein R3E39_29060 [Anaerolineae bacterium]
MSDYLSEQENQPAALGDLLTGGDGTPLTEADIVHDERKAKPKRKPKPRFWSGGRTLYPVLAAGGIGFLLAVAMVLFVTPVRQESTVQVVPVTVPVIISPTPLGLPVVLDVPSLPTPAVPDDTLNADRLVGQWVRVDGAYNMPPNTLAFVLSKDTNGEWYNVADSSGTLALVPPQYLSPADIQVPDTVRPPIGPFDYAIDKMEKLVVVLDQHGDIAPGTPVYVMGWRAEDGSWIYQVSKDLVKPEYVPAGFLAWAPGVVPPTLEPLPLFGT